MRAKRQPFRVLSLKERLFVGMSLVFFIGYLGYSLYIVQKYKTYINDKLPIWLAKVSENLYDAQIGDLKINFITRRVTIKDIDFKYNVETLDSLLQLHKQPGAVVNAYIKEISITDIMWEDLLLDKGIDVHTFSITAPRLNVELLTTDAPEKSKSKKSTHIPSTIRQIGQTGIEKLQAKLIIIKEPEITISPYIRDDSDPFFVSKSGYIYLKDWNYTVGQPKDTSLLFYAKEGKAVLAKMGFYQPNSDYFYRIDSLKFNPANSSCEINNFKMFNLYSKEKFYKILKRQGDYYTISLPHVFLKTLHWQKFLYQNTLIVDTLVVKNPHFHIDQDRTYKDSTVDKTANFPTKLLQSIGIPYLIKQIKLQNGNVEYTEVGQKTSKEATVYFTSLNGNINNITNQLQLRTASAIDMYFEGLFMNNGQSVVKLSFPYETFDSGGFDGLIHMQNIDENDLRFIASYLGLINFESIDIQSLAHTFKGDLNGIQYNTNIQYKDLKLGVLKFKENDQSIKNRPLLSALANAMLIYESNPMANDTIRLVSGHVERNVSRSFLNLVWRSLLSATLHTALKEPAILDELNKRKAQKELRKLKRAEKKSLAEHEKNHHI